MCIVLPLSVEDILVKETCRGAVVAAGIDSPDFAGVYSEHIRAVFEDSALRHPAGETRKPNNLGEREDSKVRFGVTKKTGVGKCDGKTQPSNIIVVARLTSSATVFIEESPQFSPYTI